MCISYGMPKDSSRVAASFMTSTSESLPMRIATFGVCSVTVFPPSFVGFSQMSDYASLIRPTVFGPCRRPCAIPLRRETELFAPHVFLLRGAGGFETRPYHSLVDLGFVAS